MIFRIRIKPFRLKKSTKSCVIDQQDAFYYNIKLKIGIKLSNSYLPLPLNPPPPPSPTVKPIPGSTVHKCMNQGDHSPRFWKEVGRKFLTNEYFLIKVYHKNYNVVQTYFYMIMILHLNLLDRSCRFIGTTLQP